MNYIGSKYSLLPFLEKHILQWVGDTRDLTLLDIFAGTGIVGHHFKRQGFRIIANDIQYYSYALNRAWVGINQEPDFQGIVDDLPAPTGAAPLNPIDRVLAYLNHLEGQEGFIYHHYCPGGTRHQQHPRQYFTDDNGKHCDAIRMLLRGWHQQQCITDDEYFYLLASLLDAIDRVANTASVYGAFLKHIKASAQKRLKLERIAIVPDTRTHPVYHCDGSLIVGQVPHDILYMDPPYNQRQYCTNYHVLETIARYDQPALNGVTGLRAYHDQKSAFCSKRQALATLHSIVKRTPARAIFLSYNSEGLMPANEIIRVMQEFGEVALQQQPYRRFRADIDSEQRKYKTDGVQEYLFCLSKSSPTSDSHSGGPGAIPTHSR